jgi:hypothetical protein
MTPADRLRRLAAGTTDERYLEACLSGARAIELVPELLAALKTLTQDSRFSLAIGGNPNAVDTLVKQVDLAIAKAEGQARS